MNELISILWAALGVIFIVAEIFTTGFVLLWFGVGALAAAVIGFAGGGYLLQFLTFFVVSVLLTILSRTIFERKKKPQLKIGADALPGKIGVVTDASRGALGEAAVKVFGSTWTAYPAHGEAPLQTGEQVVVDSISGASIRVRRAALARGWQDAEPPAPDAQ